MRFDLFFNSIELHDEAAKRTRRAARSRPSRV
jgi:hypothetical protein